MERRSISGPEEAAGRTIYGVDLDISCRKKIEEELAAAVHSLTRERERLNVALLVGQLGVYEWRIGEESVWWSPETYTLYGVDPESFTPTIQSFSSLVHPADREELWRKSQQAIAQEPVFEHEYRIIRPDGEVRWIINRSHVGLSELGAGRTDHRCRCRHHRPHAARGADPAPHARGQPPLQEPPVGGSGRGLPDGLRQRAGGFHAEILGQASGHRGQP